MLDLKQGRGGLVDLEFILQYLVLAHAQQQPQLASSGNTRQLLAVLAGLDLLPPSMAGELVQAHDVLLQAALACTLDDRPRIVPHQGDVVAATTAITRAWQHLLPEPS